MSLVGMWLIVVAVFLDVWVAFFRGQRDRLDQFPHLVALRLPLLPISNYEAEKPLLRTRVNKGSETAETSRSPDLVVVVVT